MQENEQKRLGGLFAVNVDGADTTLYRDGQPVREYVRDNAKKRRDRPPLGDGPLQNPRRKLERAREHIRELSQRIDAHFEAQPVELSDQQHPETGDLVIYVIGANRVPDDIGAIVGDVANNLRFALDHIVCDLVRMRGGNTGGSGLLVRDQPKRLKSGTIGKLKELGPRAEHFVCSLHGRKRWHSGAKALNALSTVDRHDRITLVNQALVGVQTMVQPPVAFQGPDGALRLLGPGTDGQRFLMPGGEPRHFAPKPVFDERVEVHRVLAGFHEQVSVNVSIAFDQTGVVDGEPVVGTLEDLAYLVEWTIGVFERRCPLT